MALAGSVRAFCPTMEYFIEKVKLHPCLWKTSEISYRDTAKKDMAWEQIARECRMVNGKEAKSQWKKLRDCHREALRRRKTSTGQAAQNLRPWKYEILMDFLLSQTENNSFTNHPTTSQDIHQDNKNTFDATYNIIESPPQPPESPFQSLSVTETDNRNRIKRVTDTFNDICQSREMRRERKKTERDDLRRTTIDMNRSQDALSNLFTSLCQKTRDLPKYLQLRVQREIFESVTRAEEEALSLDTNSATPTFNLPSSSYGYTVVKSYQSSPLPEASPLSNPSPHRDALTDGTQSPPFSSSP